MKHLYATCLVFTAGVMGCDPVKLGGVSLVPEPEWRADSVSTIAHKVTMGLGQRHELQTHSTNWAIEHWGSEWQECMSKGRFLLCWRAHENGVAFYMREDLVTEWSAPVTRIRNDLFQGLRDALGVAAVRDCDWRWDKTLRRYSCVP